MKTLPAFVIAFLAATFLFTPQAEAKRFGGGLNLGKHYSAPRAAPQRQSPQATSTPSRPVATQATGGSGRWLGPLAGLAAGGLIASLFLGDAFEGLQVLDLLLIAVLAFGAVMLFRSIRRGGASPATAGAYGGAPPRPAVPGAQAPHGNAPQAGPAPDAGAGGDEAPAWFDGPAFVEGAKTHFIRLQVAWDQADFSAIREYTTPDLLAELERERRRLEGEGERPLTEVVTLEAELVGVHRAGDTAVASVAFSGLIREEQGRPASRFHEIWHVQHPWRTREGDWLITGIQQVSG